MLDFDAIVGRDEIDYLNWKTAEDREFEAYLDRDFRNCVTYAYMLDLPGDPWEAGGAMFEVGPMEVLSWDYHDALGVPQPWQQLDAQ